MDYAKAKQIVEEVAPELVIGADTGMPHIDVYKKDGRIPFSISLPKSTDDMPMEPEDEQVVFIQGIQAAKRHLDA